MNTPAEHPPRTDPHDYGYDYDRRRLPARSDGGNSGSGGGWKIALYGVGLLAALAVAANAKDLYRYIKISRM